mmetsp:Transcript_17203/g.53766  ORF Transcript_17203/g.53766 Transcript_17203/m.53766 type:complete len:210 (-) Transcript_17203:111-740(-)
MAAAKSRLTKLPVDSSGSRVSGAAGATETPSGRRATKASTRGNVPLAQAPRAALASTATTTSARVSVSRPRAPRPTATSTSSIKGRSASLAATAASGTAFDEPPAIAPRSTPPSSSSRMGLRCGTSRTTPPSNALARLATAGARVVSDHSIQSSTPGSSAASVSLASDIRRHTALAPQSTTASPVATTQPSSGSNGAALNAARLSSWIW